MNEATETLPTAAPLHVREYRPADRDAVIALWRACELTRPWNDPARDIERRRAIEDGLFLVGVCPADDPGRRVETTLTRAGPGTIVASAMGGYDGHRGAVYYVAVHPDRRGAGHGRVLMGELEARLLARGCPKLNLQVRGGNAAALAFYARLGFAVDDVVGLGKRLIPDD